MSAQVVSIGGMSMVVIEPSTLGPDAWEPVEQGQAPTQGRYLVALQFGKWAQTDRDARIMRAAMAWSDGDDSRPLYVAEMTAAEFNRVYNKVKARLRVVRVTAVDTHQEVFVQAESKYSLESMQVWLEHCIKSQLKTAVEL